ncbi:hypothetical protein GOODEAATRI_003187 [Goodea atripinnis]|uniref:Uncharacterized protein n=1 Tax=Goodea atripinnis TaxID=208336 RepID=A0ABV0NRG6_9TELE
MFEYIQKIKFTLLQSPLCLVKCLNNGGPSYFLLGHMYRCISECQNIIEKFISFSNSIHKVKAIKEINYTQADVFNALFLLFMAVVCLQPMKTQQFGLRLLFSNRTSNLPNKPHQIHFAEMYLYCLSY